MGLPSTQKQVVVNFQGDWIERGKSYLIDGQRDEKGEVHPSICGASGEAEERYTSELLDFLRQRGSGKAPTSLSVYVEDDSAGIPDVDVTITNGKQAWTKTTDAEGFAEFTVPEPGKYTISAQKRFYALDPEMKSDLEVEVLVGSCSGGRVTLRAQGEVAGSVQNAQTTPVSGLHLQLLSVSDSKGEEFGRHWYSTETDAAGKFHFQSVSPGRYYLGTNVREFPPYPNVLRTFYPGVREKKNAQIVEVKLDQSQEGLIFSLPDYGPKRLMEFCVVDGNGLPVPDASLGNSFNFDSDDNQGAIESKLQLDSSGCVRTIGFSQAEYRVSARLTDPSGSNFLSGLISDPAIIAPGNGSVRQLFVLQEWGLKRTDPPVAPRP